MANRSTHVLRRLAGLIVLLLSFGLFVAAKADAPLARSTAIANAADTRTITFDDRAPGPITTEYEAQGVDFGRTPSGGLGGYSTIRATPTSAHSPPNSLWIGCGVEVCPAHVFMDFTTPHSFVNVYAGTDNTAPSQTVTITAYDLSGNVLTSHTQQIGPSQSTLLQVISSAGDIWYVEIASPSGWKYVFLDDLTFDVPPGNPPDFGIVGSSVEIRSGTSASVSLLLQRRNGSSGPINLSTTSPLPAGVTVSFPVNPVDGPDGTRIAMRVEAALGAPPAVRFPVRITGSPASPSSGPSARALLMPFSVADSLTDYDLRARGLEITQAIQPGGPDNPLPSSTSTATPRVFRYTGVPLAYGHPTLVRLYADARNARPLVEDVDARLYGFDAAGRPLPGSPLLPDHGTRTLVDRHTDSLAYEERRQRTFEFTLPTSWTGGPLRLRAELIPRPAFWDEARPIECLAPSCHDNNSIELTGIDFRIMANEQITPVHLVYRGADERSPAAVFRTAQAVMPIGIITPWYRGEINVDGIVYKDHPGGDDDARTARSRAILDALEDWNDDRAETGTVIVGIAGWMYKSAPAADAKPCPDASSCTDSGMERGDAVGFGDNQPYAVVNDRRPLDSVAHELGHALGRKHASPACEGDKNEFEPWPPDNRGQIQGLGVDVREKPDGTHDIYWDTRVDDYMSYCSDAGQWTSVRGWTYIADAYRLSASTASASAPSDTAGREARGASLRVEGDITGSGATITRVRPTTTTALQGPPTSPIAITAQNAAGATIASVPAVIITSHVDRSGGVSTFEAKVPAAGVQSVAAVEAGRVIAKATRSAHAPQVRVLDPKRGSRIGRQNTAVFRWQARDADGGRLTVDVEYSTNNGQSWDPLYLGPDTGRIRLTGRLFTAARHARVRIRVNDGFNEGQAVSAPFQAIGAPPIATIRSPRPQRLPNDASLQLSGYAFDDRGRQLTGRSLRWYDGKRLIGRGTDANVTGLPPGRHWIRLVARDRLGRTGAATVRVRLTAARPQFLVANGPEMITHDASSVAFEVAASIPAKLQIGAHKYRVGRRPKRIIVPIARGTTTLVLKLELRAFGKSEFRTIQIGRS